MKTAQMLLAALLAFLPARHALAEDMPLTPAQVKKFASSCVQYLSFKHHPDGVAKREKILKEMAEYEQYSWKGLRKALASANNKPFLPPFKGKSRVTLRFPPQGIETCTFELSTPAGIAPGKPAPLAVLLHGGGRGVGEGSQIMSLLGPSFQKRGCILAAPTVPPDCVWAEPKSEAFVTAIIWEICASYPVDPDRIYVAGHSMGGVGAWSFGTRFPSLFAGFGAAAGNPPNVMDYDLFHNTPFYVVHGSNDVQVSPDMDIAAQKAVDALDPKPLAFHFDFFQADDDRGHGFPHKKIEEMASFLASRSREMFVKRAVCTAPFAQVTEGVRDKFHAFWLGIDERPYKGKAVGEIAESNLLRIRTQSVSKICVFVSDDFLDLSRNIAVEIDGRKAFDGKVKRSVKFMLDHMEETQDRGRVFANVVRP